MPFPPPGDLPNPRIEPVSLTPPTLTGGFFTASITWEAQLKHATAKPCQSCPTVQRHRWQPTRLPHPWDSPGKNTGVGCHLLLQCMKVESEREVAQSCPTPSDPMDCSPPGSSVHGSFQARVLEWVASAFSKLKHALCTKIHRCYFKLNMSLYLLVLTSPLNLMKIDHIQSPFQF